MWCNATLGGQKNEENKENEGKLIVSTQRKITSLAF